jgi:hypothetical protein
MTRHPSNREESLPVFRVEAPRKGDAIGQALRGLYDRDAGLPDEMTALLMRLNGATTIQ